jgi:hypothetical protein
MTAQVVFAYVSTLTAIVEPNTLEIEKPELVFPEPTMSFTGTGTLLSMFDPSPNWPCVFEPQHHAEPSTMTAHAELAPAVSAVAVAPGAEPSMPTTLDGDTAEAFVPLPSSP